MDVEEFIRRWSNLEGGAERANYAMFLTELCSVLGVPSPEPAHATAHRNDYVFERMVRKADGANGRIDLYRRDCFVLEAKQSRQIVGGEKFVAGAQIQPSLLPDDGAALGKRPARRGWDILMVNARRQAEDYARELPQDHGWPPFVIVCDVGNCLEVYADFRRMGKYEQFPDRQQHRVFLEDLRRPEVRDRLRAIWIDPHGLDPAKRSAKATREIAARLAEVSKRLEARGYPAEEVAHFLMRCLFTMFSEDVGLLPEASFQGLLRDCVDTPDSFAPLLDDLWKAMDTGGFAVSIRTAVKRFNGALFKQARVLALGREEIGELLAAAKQDWRDVEPAIFGTLLEQALDPKERQRLGAHYTPRAYVERLVTATIIEPLREEWAVVLATVEARRAEGDMEGAVQVARAFHTKLCSTRVLDPACGTGNFLYVSLDLMKRLEADVLETLDSLGWHQQGLSWLAGQTVDPHQFLGLELNPRAAAIAELVLWIGFLQLHFKTSNQGPAEPILQAFANINLGRPSGLDALMTWTGYPTPQFDTSGGAAKQVFPGVARPVWPAAEFIVGNPPFIGAKLLRTRLGDEYTEALWLTARGVNASADFVMFWWDRAAELLITKGSVLRRFGFVTTNSITQEFSRRVIKRRLEGKTPISLIHAVPDHPWTKAGADAAAVRIAMTVAERGKRDGLLREVTREGSLETDEPQIEFVDRRGRINPDLTLGTDVTAAEALRANERLCSPGVKLHGDGFIVTRAEAKQLGLGRRPGLEAFIREYRNGRDLTAHPRDVLVIDLFGLTANEVREHFPEIYQHLKSEVKEKIVIRGDGRNDHVGRDWNNRETYKSNWWIFGEPRTELRSALKNVKRYIATPVTQKHRIFSFLDASILPDDALIAFALDTAEHLAVLSSSIHVAWALATGGWLGVGNDARYLKSRCYDPFPFPSLDGALKAGLREAGERLDAFRKARQAEHPDLTLTGIYNVREALRAGRDLTAEEVRIKDEGLVLILAELHAEVDALTLQAYGWPEGLSDEQVVERVVALNVARAAEERRGTVRWLRPDFQKTRAAVATVGGEQTEADLGLPLEAVLGSFPRDPVEQSAAVAAALASATTPITPAAVAAAFRKDKRTEAKIATILAAFVRTGFATTTDSGQTFRARRVA